MSSENSQSHKLQLKRTPLYEEHVRLGGKIVDFAGWEMPVEFEGLRAEHNRVRSKVGLFDVSHMGEIRFEGPEALATLQWLTSNDLSKISAGRAQYSLLTNDSGGVVDDLIIYCIQPQTEYLAVVNAANIEKDFEWMKAHNKGAKITNESEEWAQIAVQGPFAMELVSKFASSSDKNINEKTFLSLPPFHFITFDDKGSEVIACTTGYTGEIGFELLVKSQQAVGVWRRLLELGADRGVGPIGLGARDTLRTEMKYSLYGHEIDDTTNPIEAGLGWVVKPQKGDFIGRGPIVQMLERGPTRKLIGFKMVDKGIPRAEYNLLSFDKKKIGKVTSGTLSPTLNESIGIGYVELDFANVGTEIFVDIRGRPSKAKVVKTPFVSTTLTESKSEKKK